MEKRRRSGVTHWITPGVFRGEVAVNVDDAIGQMIYSAPKDSITKDEANHPTFQTKRLISLAEEWLAETTDVKETIHHLQEQVEEYSQRICELETQCKRDREFLHQLVLALKREWEEYRNEGSDG